MSDINDLTDEQLDAAFNDAAAEADSELSLSNFSGDDEHEGANHRNMTIYRKMTAIAFYLIRFNRSSRYRHRLDRQHNKRMRQRG